MNDFKILGWLLVLAGSFFISLATDWYVGPSVALMIVGNELIEHIREKERSKRYERDQV